MKSKYYTPDISDLFVGYECEKAILDYSSTGLAPVGWEPYKIGQDANWEKGLREMETFILWNTRSLRTPYLTKEQIESEGWKYEGAKDYLLFGYDVMQGFHNAMEKGDYVIQGRSLFGSQHLKIFDRSDQEGAHCVFEGFCPSINEFRKICKLLGI